MIEQKSNLSAKLLNGGMRLFFRLLYHSFAGAYDTVAKSVSLGHWNDWVLSSLKLVSGPCVLELGFGPGHLQAQMAQKGISAFGLDESWQMAHQARRRLINHAAPSRLARGLAQHLPYVSQAFNDVVATFPTLYIVEPETLQEIQRVLKPGGRLVVLWAAWITGKSTSERFLRRVYQATNESPAEEVDLASFVQPFQEAGFRASLRFVEMPGARLMYIIASKSQG